MKEYDYELVQMSLLAISRDVFETSMEIGKALARRDKRRANELIEAFENGYNVKFPIVLK